MTGPAGASHLVLVGMMGTGKTTVGRALADRLGRPFRDSDAEIEARTGRTVAQIFAEDGEAAFRREEAGVLAEDLGAARPSVIAAAGGTVLDPRNRDRMRAAGTVVWLRAPVEVLVERVATGTHRPAVDADPQGTLARMETDREALYAEVADVAVDSTRPVDELVEEILAAVRELEGSTP